jgi:molybdenum cofactor cytidylyltransferase
MSANAEKPHRVGLLLAAGQSRRFGAADKLLAPLDGRPLVAHAAQAMRQAAFDHLIAVVSSHGVSQELAQFERVVPEEGGPAQSASLRAGIAAACAHDPAVITVVLADMPRVDAALIDAVTELALKKGAAAATNGTGPMPPAAFTKPHFEALQGMSGDSGAREILAHLPSDALVPATPGQLADIDTPEDLASL